MAEAGRLLASGRDSDIFEYGPGLVLRRAKGGRTIEREARVMEYAVARGYPAPRVHEVLADGTEIVMQRLEGSTLMHSMASHPWALARHTTLLADLHDQLHRIPAPDWMPPSAGSGDRLLHLDLHPLNVMMLRTVRSSSTGRTRPRETRSSMWE